MKEMLYKIFDYRYLSRQEAKKSFSTLLAGMCRNRKLPPSSLRF